VFEHFQRNQIRIILGIRIGVKLRKEQEEENKKVQKTGIFYRQEILNQTEKSLMLSIMKYPMHYLKGNGEFRRL